MTETRFTATFWGTRGGYAVPGVETAGFGGNTTCLEINAGERLIIIDAGTGIIDLGRKLARHYFQTSKPLDIVLLFTHTHTDHTQGFPFFAPTHFGTANIRIFGPRMLHEDLEDILRRSMLPMYFPVELDELEATISIKNIREDQKLVVPADSKPQMRNVNRDNQEIPPDSIVVHVMHSYAHPKGGALMYRLEYGGKSLVFATDTEGYAGGDKRLINFSKNADVLIHDGEYVEAEYTGEIGVTRQGWGHSTWNMAVEVAKMANVGKLYLTHHNAGHTDAFLEQVEREVQAVFPNALYAREQHTIVL